jgi:hypothetical protein
MRVIGMAVVIVSAVTACTHVTPEQQLAASQQVTCSGQADCELKWARATKWLQDNSYWKLRTVTESVLTTEGPNGRVNTAYEVNKFPLGNGVYEIQFKAGCSNKGLGCHPSTVAATASFKRYLMTGEVTSP